MHIYIYVYHIHLHTDYVGTMLVVYGSLRECTAFVEGMEKKLILHYAVSGLSFAYLHDLEIADALILPAAPKL